MTTGAGGTEKRQLLPPNYKRVIVKEETCGEGGWWLSPPLYLLSVSAHAGGDNMAATDRNLLLELRIKDTEADRNLLSNTHTVDANREVQKV